jgi:peptidyl-prolyl cis-trans isomerase D
VNKLYSILGGAAVIAIALVFIVQFRPATGATKTATGPACAAEVGGVCISAAWFWASYRLMAANANPSKLSAVGFRRRVADGLIEAWLLNQDASRLGITVADDDVRAEIAKGRAHVSLPAADTYSLGGSLGLGEEMVRLIPVKSPKTKQFDRKVYEKEVPSRTHLSVKDFLDYQRVELIAARMREMVRARVRVGENEAYEKFARDKSTATVEYVRFDRRFFSDVVVDLSPKNVEAWSEGHRDEIDKVWETRKSQVMPECRSFREMFFKLDEAPTDEDKAAGRRKADRALERVLAGQAFADVARAMSEGPSALRGGVEGCLLRGKLPKPIEDAVLHLDAGKVSDVVTLEGGYAVVIVDEIAGGDAAEKAGRSFVARDLFMTEESERLASEAAKSVLAAAAGGTGGKPLSEVVDSYIEDLVKRKEASEDTKATKSDKKKRAENAAKKANVSTDGGTEPDADPPPTTPRNHPNRPTVETSLPFNAAGNPISGARQPSEVTRVAFALDKPGDLAGELIPTDNGYAILKLKDKAPVTKEQWEKDRDYYTANMRAAKAQDALVAYMARLRGKLAKDTKYVGELVNEAKSKGKDEGPAPTDDDDQGE